MSVEAPVLYDLHVPGSFGVNNSDSPEKKAAMLAKKNTPEFFEDIFTQRDPYVVAVDQLPGGARIAYSAAPGAYSFNPDLHIFTDEAGRIRCLTADGKVVPYTLQDTEPVLQCRAIHREMALLRAYEDHFKPGDPGMQVSVVENVSPFVRLLDGKDPAKTLSKPHPRVTAIDPRRFVPSVRDWRTERFLQEQLALRKHFPGFYAQGEEQIRELLDYLNVEMIPDEEQAKVTFLFPFGRDDAVDPANIQTVQQVRAAHYNMYGDLTNDLYARYGRRYPAIGQHLMRQTFYMRAGFDRYNGQYANEFVYGPYDGWGTVERFWNASLHRDPNLSPLYPDDALKDVLRPVVDAARATVWREEERHAGYFGEHVLPQMRMAA